MNLAPLRVSLTMHSALAAYEKGELDAEARARLDGFKASLRDVGRDGLLHPGRWWREPTGRIHLMPQGIANLLRPHIVPSEPNRLFIDADFVGAHITIAATRSGDTSLMEAVSAGTCYEVLAGILPDAPLPVRRGIAKITALSQINGGGSPAVEKALRRVYGDIDLGRLASRLLETWKAAYPTLHRYVRALRADIQRALDGGAEVYEVQTLAGRLVPIPLINGGGAALSAHWSTGEAEVMDGVLTEIDSRIAPFGGRLCLPMFDGLLLDAPKEYADAVAQIVQALMVEQMAAVGVRGATVKASIRPQWGDAPPKSGPTTGDRLAAMFHPFGEGRLDTGPPPRPALLRLGMNYNAPVFLPRGKVAMLAAAGGTGKTQALVQLAISLSTGLPWLDTFGVDEPGNVVLALGEEDEEEVHRRLYWIGRELGLDAEQRRLVESRVYPLPLTGESVVLVRAVEAFTPEGGRYTEYVETDTSLAIRELLERTPWRCVILDPASRFMGQDSETDNAAATRFIEVLERYTKAPGRPTVLMSHHTSKTALSGVTDQGAARGSSALTDGARWQGNLERVARKGGAPRPNRARLRTVKSNYTAYPDTPLELMRGREGVLRPAPADVLRLEREEEDPKVKRSDPRRDAGRQGERYDEEDAE